MDQWKAIETCHEIWYIFMHQQEADDLLFPPESFFENVVLDTLDLELDGPLYKRAMGLLYDYLDNMPHWLLEGHTPQEMNTLKQVRKPFSAVKQRPAKNMAYNYDDMESLFSFLDDSLNPVSFGKVNRNEPCPCGSGKKYKHCCGKGN
ncbi:MAG: SEC-C domain-containing protein [Bacteroidaceae bacterium]|nr:SEC-C domain-containing protein [Bacteroidaceae bacterium]